MIERSNFHNYDNILQSNERQFSFLNFFIPCYWGCKSFKSGMHLQIYENNVKNKSFRVGLISFSMNLAKSEHSGTLVTACPVHFGA